MSISTIPTTENQTKIMNLISPIYSNKLIFISPQKNPHFTIDIVSDKNFYFLLTVLVKIRWVIFCCSFTNINIVWDSVNFFLRKIFITPHQVIFFFLLFFFSHCNCIVHNFFFLLSPTVHRTCVWALVKISYFVFTINLSFLKINI